MFLLDWLTSLLRLLGLSSKKARIVILGVLLIPPAMNMAAAMFVSQAHSRTL